MCHQYLVVDARYSVPMDHVMSTKAKIMKSVCHDISLLTEHDIYLFKEGSHFQLYNKLGAHPMSRKDVKGTHFAVWAPNAQTVSVVGDFNGWNRTSHQLGVRWDGSGIWEGFIPGVHKGSLYKYCITSKHNNYQVEKKDPFAFFSEIPPKTASVIWDLDYEWQDTEWMKTRCQKNALNQPTSVYEIHLGSWRRKVEEGNRFLTYREMAGELVEYVRDMGFTHVEFMPVMEHPFYGSWGYQTLGLFAPTNRYGPPQDLMYLIDCFHQNGIGVILDWVPSHFPSDEHGLVFFDGTHLYEHGDPQKGFHPDWKSYIFNTGRHEVKEFLISSALFWLERYHVDGLRVDAVASMLYLDYSRKEGEWIANRDGGRENLESIDFIRTLNKTAYGVFPDVQVIAEESTAWSGVSRPTDIGGLGFGMKWNMGWMHDTLEYFKKDPAYRKHHHDELTFSMLYAFTENFVLSISHDEVVHGKASLLGKMPGDDWQKFANVRLLLGYMYAHPGKKLLFMGAEFGQWAEWDHEKSLDWHLLQYAPHRGIRDFVKELNAVYRQESALYDHDFDGNGFEWISADDRDQSVLCFLRKGISGGDTILAVCNFTPVPRYDYRVGVPGGAGTWQEILNSDGVKYGGSGVGNPPVILPCEHAWHGREHSISLNLPPLGIVYLKHRK